MTYWEMTLSQDTHTTLGQEMTSARLSSDEIDTINNKTLIT